MKRHHRDKQDITNEKRSATNGAEGGTESEYRAIVDRAYVPHEAHRHNGRGKLMEMQL